MGKKVILDNEKVLIAYASKHGSTKEIALKIASVLTDKDLLVEVIGAGKSIEVAGYDAVIIGSAIYAGNWLKEAKKFIDEYSSQLKKTKVWLFSDGPIGSPLKPTSGSAMSAELINSMLAKTQAREHKLLAGKLDVKTLNFGEKLITKVLKTSTGDYRDWQEVEAWAKAVAKEIKRH